jgi:hypothetical protein
MMTGSSNRCGSRDQTVHGPRQSRTQLAPAGRRPDERHASQAAGHDSAPPVVLEQEAKRAADLQLRIADWITGFAGSMQFVYLHIVIFTI